MILNTTRERERERERAYFKEIKRLQNSTDLLLPKATFQRVVKGKNIFCLNSLI